MRNLQKAALLALLTVPVALGLRDRLEGDRRALFAQLSASHSGRSPVRLRAPGGRARPKASGATLA